MALFDLQSLLNGGFLGRAWAGERVKNKSKSNLRLAVVDSAQVVSERIAQALPPDVELVRLETFTDAETSLIEDPPDAVVFCIVPCFSMWRVLIERCLVEHPLIPFLCCAKVEANPPCSCAIPCREEDLFPWDLELSELSPRIAALIEECRARNPERFAPGRAALPDIDGFNTPQFDFMS